MAAVTTASIWLFFKVSWIPWKTRLDVEIFVHFVTFVMDLGQQKETSF